VFRKAEKLRLRSRGCRSITADFKLEIGTVADRAFFIHGFAKNGADNIGRPTEIRPFDCGRAQARQFSPDI